jgi:hypothetical protein
MTLRVLGLCAVLGVACFVPHAGPGGLLERFPHAPDAVVVHVVVPFLLAIALAVMWPHLSWIRAALALALGLLPGQVARMAVLASHAQLQQSQLWGRLLTDSKDQFLLALSLVMQIGSGLLVLTGCKLVVRRVAQPAAAAAEPRGTPGADQTPHNSARC